MEQASVLDNRVEPPETIERELDGSGARVFRFEVLEARDRGAACVADLARDRLCNCGVVSGPVCLDPGVVDDDGGPSSRELSRIHRAEATPGPGHQDDAPVEANLAHAAFSAAALPARRPNTVHSSSELPIMRLRPCVPPAISPQA